MDPNKPPQAPNPNTSQYDQLTAAMESNRKDIGTREAAIPTTIAQYAPANDSTISALRGQQADKVKQLFAHDQQLAQVYTPMQAAPGASTGQVTMPDQQIMNPLTGQIAATQQSQNTVGELTDIMTQIAKRKDDLNTSRTDALDLLKTGLSMKQQEQQDIKDQLAALTEKAKNQFTVMQSTGGDISPELAAALGDPSLANKHIPGELEKIKATYGNTTEGRKSNDAQAIQTDVANGAQLKDVIANYANKGLLSDQQVLALYDNAATAKGWGPHKETISQLRAMGLADPNLGKGIELSTTDQTAATNSAALVQMIDDATNALKAAPASDFSGLGGIKSGALLNSPFAQSLNPNTLTALQKFNFIQLLKDKPMLGGRPVQGLVERLSPSYAGSQFSIQKNLQLLAEARNQAIQQLNIEARNRGYADFTELPGFEGMTSGPTDQSDSSAGGSRPPLTSFDK